MKIKKLELFAIYKNGEHKGNQRGSDEIEAVNRYVIDSLFEDYLTDKEFMKQYSAIIALDHIHFLKSENTND